MSQINNLSIIVAIANNQVIGNNNELIWHIPEDLKRFKALTMGHHIIMGRKTWESIGRALPGRISIVITRNPDFQADDCVAVGSLEQAIGMSASDSEVFVIGGGEIYGLAMPLANRLYVTHIHQDFEGDTVFPPIDVHQWAVEKSEEPANKGGLFYRFVNYKRKGS